MLMPNDPHPYADIFIREMEQYFPIQFHQFFWDMERPVFCFEEPFAIPISSDKFNPYSVRDKWETQQTRFEQLKYGAKHLVKYIFERLYQMPSSVIDKEFLPFSMDSFAHWFYKHSGKINEDRWYNGDTRLYFTQQYDALVRSAIPPYQDLILPRVVVLNPQLSEHNFITNNLTLIVSDLHLIGGHTFVGKYQLYCNYCGVLQTKPTDADRVQLDTKLLQIGDSKQKDPFPLDKSPFIL
jgi:hypothetical protein